MNTADVRKEGYLRRLKTQKRRFFVLRTISSCGKPRFEYYESEKKYRSSCLPKRVIQLSSCFNITRKDDTKFDYVFALYTREDVFGLICDSKDELQSWLDALLNEQVLSSSSQRNDYLSDNVGDIKLPELRQEVTVPPVTHESSWPVTVKPRGLGTSKNLAGTYNLKLVDHTLSLHKTQNNVLVADFHLTIVRRCGHTDCFFFMEVGRSSVTGAGELWMQVDDPILAKNLHEVVLMSMQSLSSDGYSSMSRYRCHSGGNKPRPTSLLLLTPPRTRSDTLPDSAPISPGQEGPPSPVKAHAPDQSSPSGSKRSAMFQRLLSVGRKKSEDFSPKLFSRNRQSNSISIDTRPKLLGRAQSMDFSSLIGSLPCSLESPEEEKEICFDVEEPQRTSSNSSGSSGRSWDHSLPRNVNPSSVDSETGSKPIVSSPRPTDISIADEGYDSTARDDNTPEETPRLEDNQVSDDDTTSKTTPDEKGDVQESPKQKLEKYLMESRQLNEDTINSTSKPGGTSQRNRSGYEDMSGKLSDYVALKPQQEENSYVNVTRQSNPNSLERERTQSPTLQRRTSEPVRSDSPVQIQSKSSPKQRRTSEPIAATSSELRELVSLKSSPLSSPRRSKKGTLKGATILEFPDTLPDDNSPSDSPKERRYAEYDDHYVAMNSLAKIHSYVNLNPKEGFKHEEEPAYMNFKPGEYRGISQNEPQEPEYMNFKPGQFDVETAEQEPSYVNFQPGSIPRSNTKSPKQRPKHTYENLHLNGMPKGATDSDQFSDYMNVAPRRHHSDRTHSKRMSLPHRGPNVPNLHRRRESEPVNMGLPGMSDEENGMLFLDFSNNKSGSSKGLNYVMVDHTGDEKRSPKGSPKSRPPNINTTLTSRPLDIGPKSAPVSTTSYAEIDFTRSHGLRQAIIDHKKTKSTKE